VGQYGISLPAGTRSCPTVRATLRPANSVQYRVRKAEEALGHPVGDNRLSVELALLASQWLGPTVLRHPRQPRP